MFACSCHRSFTRYKERISSRTLSTRFVTVPLLFHLMMMPTTPFLPEPAVRHLFQRHQSNSRPLHFTPLRPFKSLVIFLFFFYKRKRRKTSSGAVSRSSSSHEDYIVFELHSLIPPQSDHLKISFQRSPQVVKSAKCRRHDE